VSQPLRKKLMTLMLLPCAGVLLLTCGTLLAYEYATFRQNILEQTATLARVIATNSTAALAFQNEDDAADVLAALKTEPHVTLAALYDQRGNLFARYPPQAAVQLFPPSPQLDGYSFGTQFLEGFQPVRETAEQRLGTLYVRSDMSGMYERLALYAAIVCGLIVVSIAMAYVLSRRLQRQISQPIIELAETARAISERGDYSVRAPVQAQAEFGVLTSGFNRMLAQIAAQDTTLRENQAKLRDQLGRLDLLQRTTRAIGDRQDLESIFQVIVRNLEDNLPIDFGFVCLYDALASQLTIATVGAKSGPLAIELGLSPKTALPVDQKGLQRCMAGELFYEPDLVNSPPGFAQRLESGGLRSLVVAPLQVESTVFGVLVAARRAPNSFSSAECEFLRQLSEHAALAAHQVGLYTALQQAYEELRQSQHTILQQERLRALGQMASGIAHDINNAISPVALYTESLLEREPNLSSRARDYLNTIQRAIADVAQTVARMREFYRRDQQSDLLPVELNQLIEQVLSLTRARWSDIPQERGIVIKVRQEPEHELPKILGTESDIRDALTNLVFNAVDAMPNGGTLVLRTRSADADLEDGSGRRPCVQLEVCDSGVGMDEDTRRRCLEPFFTTKGERGTGMGLAMVYGMVRRHGGLIEIDSALGTGTTVRLIFARASSTAQSMVGDCAPLRVTPLRLLVIDDDPLLAESLLRILESEGHTVTLADGGAAGIEAFTAAHRAGKTFDVVMTDLGMPYIDGRAVAAAVKQLDPHTPVLLLTGWGQRLRTEHSVPAHVDLMLGKPPRLHELRRALVELTRATESETMA
jgi:signal transduction histidine kinase/ActR/RegA family two-component response regulator/HAMP domain-containing protein